MDFDHSIKDNAAAFVSDKDFVKRAERWPVDTPDTKEAYYIREIFDGKRYLEVNQFEVHVLIFARSFPLRSRSEDCSTVSLGQLFFGFFLSSIGPAGYHEVTGVVPRTQAGVASAFTTRRTKKTKSIKIVSYNR